MQSLQRHQREAEKNIAAENNHVRKTVWGSDGQQEDEADMHSQTILGDVTHPTPIVIQPQQSNGIGKVLAGAALAAGLIGIPAAGVAGYLLNEHFNKPAESGNAEDNTVDIGLLRMDDIQKQSKPDL